MVTGKLVITDSTRAGAVCIFCACIIAALFIGRSFRILPVISIFGLVITALSQPDLKNKLVKLPRQKSFLAFMGIFFIHFLTFFYADPENYAAWWQGVVWKLPFLFLPLAFGLLPAMPHRFYYLLYYLFFLLVLGAALYSLIAYACHFHEINEAYIRSDVMPTWGNHVRYSLMVALAIIIGGRLWQLQFYVWHRAEHYFIMAATMLLFVFIHLLAVRSGLVSLYGVLGLYILYLIFFKRKLKWALIASSMLVSAPILSYYTLPTFYNKFQNTITDLNQVETEGSANNYSIAGRVYSYRVAMVLIKEHPLLGVGMGNMRSEINKTYRRHFPEIKEEAHLIPHNQYLHYVMMLGIIGFSLFMILFFYPLFAHFRQADSLFWVQYVVVGLSFLFEPTLETQVGLLFSLLFILLPLHQLKNQATIPDYVKL